MAIKLSLNLNAVALLRNRRNLPWPSLIEVARYGLQAGAHGITIHPRPDERHIRFSDIKLLRDFLKTEFKDAIFNIEGYPSEEFLEKTLAYADQITLVPDSPEQNTSDHGWNLATQGDILARAVEKIKKHNIIISAFIDAGVADLSLIKTLNIDKIELYTGPYALAYNNIEQRQKHLRALEITASTAQKLDLSLNAGHDLTVENLPLLISKINNLDEVSIGHALIADAIIYGIEKTVKRFLSVLTL